MLKHGSVALLVTLISITPNILAQSVGQAFQSTSAANLEQSVQSDSRSQLGENLVVQWQNEQLTVRAHRATLGSVLSSIAKQTGLVLEVSPGTDVGLVYLDVGPGTMHDVLSSLLDGDANNYILVGSARKPGFVDRLVLSRANQTRVVAANEVPAPPIQPQLYGAGFSATPDPVSNESAPATEATKTEASTALPPVQTNINSTIQQYQQNYAEMMKSGKSRAEILNELQRQQIRDFDAQAATQPPQQQ